jgi:hypothetical protein
MQCSAKLVHNLCFYSHEYSQFVKFMLPNVYSQDRRKDKIWFQSE